jgi:biopolymer transport protein ExbD
MARALNDPVLIIQADAGASHQAVMNVLEAARQAGLAKVTFAAKSGSK